MLEGLLTFDDFLVRRGSDRRLARLTHDVPLPQARGLEFGPGDNPTPLPLGVSVSYVGRSRENEAEADVPLDIEWGGVGSLRDRIGECEFDFAIAAQVAQYVPDLLGWLSGIHEVLRDGGVLNLSIPDKRFMFDTLRNVSQIEEFVEAHLLHYDRPSPRQIFAHTYGIRSIDAARIWDGADPTSAPRLCADRALETAYAQAMQALDPRAYPGCHCWVFTPSSLLEVLKHASRLKLFPFVLNHVSAVEPDGDEFFVSMRKDPEKRPDILLEMQVAAIGYLQGILERRRRRAALMAMT